MTDTYGSLKDSYVGHVLDYQHIELLELPKERYKAYEEV